MLRSLLISVVALSLTVGPVALALAADMGVMTGSEKGTYYQFGLNLQALGKSNGINLSVYPSKGSVENIYAVYQRPGVQVGIVQSDVLAFVAKVQTDQTLQRIAKKIKMVFPLYNEEVHLLARKGIASFDDLAGKRVAIGREGSGTYLTVRLLFKVSEVAPREMVLIDTDGALAELRAGRIDAMFFVAGYPVRLLAEGVAAADNLVLVPITNKDIAEFYPSVTIPANTYAWQPEPVQTVAVKAVLVSFDYRRGDCDNVGRLAQVLSTNFEWLTKNGHPKWKTVNLEFPLKGWEQYDCVKKYLNKPTAKAASPQKSSEINPVMDAIREMLRE
ncbi:MAG: TRAP transporter substrate-binding protein [Candidatus Rokuibacteriota bacterium]|nr:MAG: TRAP transporter substrate-binding protein [Candidatus Rokubacteria bacterium]PYM65723.1 MAG: TRAP transporter substrate-binding protein [Candidatus Rokubacteria bacterium]PYN65404.1 MAG: TRAP transporter substrate-binding protein [Candidatus Rokubacteria bacterium]